MRRLIILILSLAAFSSCKIFKPSLMLKTPRDFNYDQLADSLARLDYRIAPNDAIQYQIFPNDGFKLIDLVNTTNNAVLRRDINVIVESTGEVKMPGVGRVKVAGLTLVEAEKLLEEKYSEYYVNPFVKLRIDNKRVIVFPGSGGAARVVNLENNNTTVLEAIAAAGGIPEDGKAYKAKLIRNNVDPFNKPFVYLMDLSTINGLALGRSKVQANDIIYIEQRYRPLRTFTTEIAPVVSLITSFFILYQFTRLR
jgi:polysaccharide biosynthesis/export protein